MNERNEDTPQGDDLRDAETELNCAEEVLDALAADLPMKRTDFDCIGDYITAVVEAVRRQRPASQPEQQPEQADPARSLQYVDNNGDLRQVKGVKLTLDSRGCYWLWSEALRYNIVYRTKGRDNALLASIDSLLFAIQLRDERISALQRVADLAQAFADQIKPDEDNHG